MVEHETLSQRMLNIPRTAFRVQRSKGFSLIELLVVIGIMAILVAILLPALSYARARARVQETTSELQAISSACEGYKVMFGAYPGPISEPDVAQNDYTQFTAGTSNFSGTQNMLLGLMGGIGGSSAVSLTIDKYPSGTSSLNANFQASGVSDWANLNGGNPRFVNAFYIPRPGEYRAVPGSTNTNPTLMDHYPDALPILYYRRDAGKTGTTGQYCVLGLYGNAGGAAYLRGANVEYTNSTTLQATTGRICDQSKCPAPGTCYSFYGTTVSSSDWNTPGTWNADWDIMAAKWVWPSGVQHNPPGGFLLDAASPDRFYAYSGYPSHCGIFLFGGEQ